jgi:hypothetical protein
MEITSRIRLTILGHPRVPFEIGGAGRSAMLPKRFPRQSADHGK